MIGICAPFSWQEQTCAAIQLATLAKDLGLGVKLYSHTAYQHYLWPEGHKQITDGRSQPFAHWVKDVSHVVWFNHRPKEAQLARGAGATTVLVVQRNLLDPDPTEQLLMYDRLICPNPSCYEYVAGTLGLPTAVAINWMPGPQREPTACNPQGWFIPLDRGTLETIGPAVFYWLQTILQVFPEISLTLLQTKSWNKQELAGLHALRASAKVHVLRHLTYSMLQESIGSNGVTLALNPRSTLGQFPLLALQANARALAWDIPPYNLLGHPGCRLLRCDTIRKANQAAEAVPTFLPLLTSIAETLAQPSLGRQNVGWDGAFEQFVEGWRQIWSIVC